MIDGDKTLSSHPCAEYCNMPRVGGLASHAVALLCGFLIAIIAFIRHALGTSLFPYDYENYHFPLWKRIFDAMRAGEFPFYDPYIYSGVPFLENTQSMLFYPPVSGFLFLLSMFQADLTIHASQFINIFHFAISYAGMVIWMRERDGAPWMAHVLALAAAFSGTMIANAQHAGVTAALAWFPWLLFVTERLVARLTARLTVTAGALLALIQLAGFQPTAVAINIVWAIYCVALIIQGLMLGNLRNSKRLCYVLLALAAAQVLHLLLSAPLWLSALIELRQGPAIFHVGSSKWTSAWTLVGPNALYSFDFSKYKAIGDPTTTYHFAGLMPLLALGAALASRRILVSPTFASAIICFFMSRDYFFLTAKIQSLPAIGILYRPFLLEVTTVILLVASLRWATDSELRRGGIGGAALLAAGVVAAVAFATKEELTHINLGHAIVFAGIAIVVLLVIGLLESEQRRHVIMSFSTILVFAFHAIVPNKIWMHSESKVDSYGMNHVDGGMEDFLLTLRKGTDGPFRVAVDQQMMGGPFNGGWRVFRIEAINGFEPTMDESYRKYMTDKFAGWQQKRIFGDFDASSPKFDELNVKYLIVRSSKSIESPRWELIFDRHYRIYRNRTFTPRFRLSTMCSTDDSVHVIERRPGFYRLSIESSCTDAQLIASERPHKGWHLEISGRPATWSAVHPAIGITANIPQGVVEAKLYYHTPHFRVGSVLAALGIVLMIVMLTAAMLRSPPTSASAKGRRQGS